MLFAVFRTRGTGWREGAMEDQSDWAAHAQFMTALERQGLVRWGGPLGECGEVMLVAEAETAAQVAAALGDDPWVGADILPVVRIEPWRLRIGTI
jgi:uncharacterized protein YciI